MILDTSSHQSSLPKENIIIILHYNSCIWLAVQLQHQEMLQIQIHNDSHWECSKCPLPVATEAFIHLLNTYTALSISSWGRLSQTDCNKSFSSTTVFSFRCDLWYASSITPRHGSPWVLGPANLEVTDFWQKYWLNSNILCSVYWYIMEMQKILR